jgi:transglutaminase-like putative cysteine protease
MRLHIEHATYYLYERSVRFGRHRLVLRPREGHDLRVVQMELRLEPAHQLTWVRDVFGNSIALVDWLEPADTLTIVSDVTIERVAPFPTRDLHDPWRVPFPPRYDPLESAITGVYQSPSFPEYATPVQSWLHDTLSPDLNDAEATMLALCRLIFRTVKYQRRLDKGVQNPARTLELGTGSCRDAATLMMEAARLLGVAARFASGYLHCAASVAGHASTHAWAEVYLPMLGWRGFDPTTGEAVSLRHVVTGVSSHPRGVMPVSGAYIGDRADYKALRVTVKTEELSEQSAAVPASPVAPVCST